MKTADKEKAMARMERRLAPGTKPAAYAASEEKPIGRKTGRGRTGNGKTQEKKTGKEAVRETLAARKRFMSGTRKARNSTAWDFPGSSGWRMRQRQPTKWINWFW